MNQYLNSIRSKNTTLSLKRKIISTIIVLCIGLFLGALSKYLDENQLTGILGQLDLSNYLGRFSIWIVLALAISIYSASPIRAGLNVLLFFTGMFITYYAYTKFISGFFLLSYIMIWVGFTLVSPFLAMLCWYAKGDGKIAIVISSGILGSLLSLTVNLTQGFQIYSYMDLITWVIAVILLRRKPKELAVVVFLSIVIAFVLQATSLYWERLIPFSFV